MGIITNDWLDVIGSEFHQPYYKELHETIISEYKRYKIFPKVEDIFNAFHLTPLSQTKAVIIGQDPYHNEGQAHGLCFSVTPGTQLPPSLVNIFKELRDDIGCQIPNNGYLEKWAKQGVLMLNTVLTVRENQAFSHKGMGWERFTDAVIRAVNSQDRPIVFILWGKPAQAKKIMLDNKRHLILEGPHPSPLSAYRGFFGSKPFSKTNEFLVSKGINSIDWKIENI